MTDESNKDIEKLQKILDFPKVGIPDSPKPSVSYHTTMQKKQLASGGLITEKIIDEIDGSTTVRYRQQTNKEKLDSLFQVLEHF